jgi:aspartate aminotransferase
MRISDRIERLSPSLTLQLIARTRQLRAEGHDVVSLAAGEPDFPTPRHVREAAVRAMEAGHTRYTEEAGVPALRTAVAALYREPWGLDYGLNETIVTSGAKFAIYQAFQCLLNEGDEVLLPRPSWLSYPDMVKAAGGVPVDVPLREEDGFKLRPDLLCRACDEHPGARVLVLNGVSNPTGAVHTPQELRAVAEVCEQRDLFVVSDEIYERLVYNGVETAPFAAVHPSARERCLMVSGVSKTFAMTGWRIGYAVGPARLVGAMRKLQGQSTSNPCSVAQYAALEALTGDQTEIEAMIQEFGRRRERIVELLRDVPDVTVARPDGAFYVFPRVDAYYDLRPAVTGSVALAEALLEETGVAVVPGAPFGSDAHVRLSYACSVDDIERALGRMQEFFRGLKTG